MIYQQALDFIAALEPRGWRLGLDRMEAFCRAAGLDQALTERKYVHVAGTNGKGSTTAYLQSILVESGFRTGAFFSPYVVDPRERVQFGRELISTEELASVVGDLRPVAESFTESEFGGVTEFEFKTAVGLEYWRRKECEWVALEVGLGGRLDATNVVQPASTVIVSIGLDHVNILGDTLSAIAGEKAGIIKPGVPVIVGNLPEEALNEVSRKADELGSPVWLYGRDVRWWQEGRVETPAGDFPGLHPGLTGACQGHNLALAIAAIAATGTILDREAVSRGAARAYAPGRFQVVAACGTTFVLDGAHNAEAADVLRRTIAAKYGESKVVLLTNMVRGHDPHDFYRHIASVGERAHVAPIDFHRALPVEETADALHRLGVPAQTHSDLTSGIVQAARDAGKEGIVLVTGSYYLVGEVIRALETL